MSEEQYQLHLEEMRQRLAQRPLLFERVDPRKREGAVYSAAFNKAGVAENQAAS